MKKTTIKQTARGYEVRINGDQWGIYQTEAEAKKMASELEGTDCGN